MIQGFFGISLVSEDFFFILFFGSFLEYDDFMMTVHEMGQDGTFDSTLLFWFCGILSDFC